jgi:hypothetical protein
LDSNYSLFSNIALNPRLIMIFGGDIPISNIPFQELVKKEYSDFTRRESLNINFIHTNALEILNRRRVDHFFRKFNYMLEANFLQWMQGSILPLGHAAPLSIGRFNRLLKAATYVEEVAQEFNEYPWDSSPSIDEKIKWANLQVKHDGCIHRHEKVLALKKTLDEHRVKLRVCMSQPKKKNFSGAMNCSRCEKCLRTIAALIIAGIDPSKCGFSIDVTTFENLRNLFEQKKLSKLYALLHWKPLQKLIPEDTGGRYASEEFFEWFKKIDLDSFARKSDPLLSVLYYKFPFQISNFVRKIFENSQLDSRA